MEKKRCKLCLNEKSGLCTVKKIGVAINKPRLCEAYIYDEQKLKVKSHIPTIKMGYNEHQESKRRLKEELKVLKKSMSSIQSQDAIKGSGLVEPSESKPITTNDPGSYIPRSDSKYPLTGDLSRFLTTAKG